jgi:hypothetical protein
MTLCAARPPARRISVGSLSETGWRGAAAEANRAPIGCRRIGRADHLCRRRSTAKANLARVGDFLGGLAYDGLLLDPHVILLDALVDDFERAPPAAAVRTALTPIGARFIKRARAGKNERFDSMRRRRGNTLLAGRRTKPALTCSKALSARFAGLLEKAETHREGRFVTKFCV